MIRRKRKNAARRLRFLLAVGLAIALVLVQLVRVLVRAVVVAASRNADDAGRAEGLALLAASAVALVRLRQ
jgi:hypothetical protein